ncbi:MAG: hypothetical protein IJ776_02550 [Paludibacteraceae bacterium]|nr:hypothetical protein [Paludibacteraceae bacterium]
MINDSHIKGWIIAISAVSVLSIVITCIIYGVNGVIPAFSISVDSDLTISFFTVIAAILTPTIAFISALLYYDTLMEQKRQNVNFSLQHFEEQFNNLIERQLKIRDQLYIIHPIIQNGVLNNVRYQGIEAFKRLWLTYRFLIQAINSRENYYDWEQFEAGYDNAKESLDPDRVLEHFEPKELDKKIEELNLQYHIAMIGHIFNIDGTQQLANTEIEAFRMIYEKFFHASSLYFTHLCSILKFLQHSFNLYSIDSKLQEEYVQRLRDNLSSAEISVIDSYSNYNLCDKQLIRQMLFTHSVP